MMDTDNAYQALTEAGEDLHARWAFGTGFSDPLFGVDTTVPQSVNRADLTEYCLMLGDDALVFSHRLTQWCTRAPELEEEVALANIALDLLGQARLLLSRAGDEDALAYFRDPSEFRNVLLAELDLGDFAHTMVSLLVFSTWRLAVMSRLVSHVDPVLSAVAAKAVIELTYHRRYAAQWVVRLGDGTPESHARMESGLSAVWPHYEELFVIHPVEQRMGAEVVRDEVDGVLAQVLTQATLVMPHVKSAAGGGREGKHTPALSTLLAETQSVARAHPGATW